MMLRIQRSGDTRTVSLDDTTDYARFSRLRKNPSSLSELVMFERYYAARSLLMEGMETLVDPVLADPRDNSTTRVDVCGIKGDDITVVFCEGDRVRPSLAESIEKIRDSDNARAVILVPSATDLTGPAFLPDSRVAVETLGWFDEEMHVSLQRTLRLIDMLGNETRMRMLAPMFRKAGAKKDYRTRINPKLVYQNLSMLTAAGLIDEMDEGNYKLTELGKSLLAEFITFLEKARKTLEMMDDQKGR